MAAVAVTVRKLTERNAFMTAFTTTDTFTAVDATDGALIPWDVADQKMLLLIQNVNASTAKSVTIKAGNGLQGVADLTREIAAGKTTAICLDSGEFKNVTGDNVGKVLITGTSADIKIAAFAHV